MAKDFEACSKGKSPTELHGIIKTEVWFYKI